MASITVREREQDDEDIERYSKRTKLDDLEKDHDRDSSTSQVPDHVLPPSHSLLGIPLPVAKEGMALNFLETDVGISEYVGRGDAKVEGIIKQRFTDFLVFEVDQDGRVVHLKSLEKPQSSKKKPATSVEAEPEECAPLEKTTIPDNEAQNPSKNELQDSKATRLASDVRVNKDNKQPGDDVDQPWPEHFTATLTQHLSKDVVLQIQQLYLEGAEPPRVSDNGWSSRAAKSTADSTVNDMATQAESEQSARSTRGRGGRGGRGRGRGGRADNRRVLSDPISSKESRTAIHKVVRELFKGKLETETDTSNPQADDGSRISVKWASAGRGRSREGRVGRDVAEGARGNYPPFIHFTLQKTNRDTQDALGHLARNIHISIKDLSVAGTKDKRGVTVQRASLKRHKLTVEEVWRLANGIGRRTPEEALTERGERGIRISDFNYRKAGLELGMLKGNAFVITLRNVKVESMQILDEAMDSIKHKGFINYYGMQRFGTASVPTHSIGLALLKSDWQKAVSLIMQKRHGEHPDIVAARDAWLIDGNLDKALELMPRRVIAERCLLESFKKQKGDTRNAMGALSTIPKNLRLMYIHAYQSYVWNVIVSERIHIHGAEKPVVGDLVFETDAGVPQTAETDVECVVDAEIAVSNVEQEGSSSNYVTSRRSYTPPRIKTLTAEDLDEYTIFDVIMPLPGTDVAYPGGKLGERYREFLRMDGLDPENFKRKQREYTLNGSYRAILHLPKEIMWSTLRYTDPDVPLAQADEDRLLGFEPPDIVDDGKFLALQIQLTLGTAAYATMALREITKTETSSHYQSNLTINAEDQKYRARAAAEGTEEVMEES